MDKENKLIDNINLTDDIVAKVTRGNTNRTHIATNTKNPVDTEKIRNLIIEFLYNRDNKIFNYIRNLVSNFDDILSNNNTTFYRAIDYSIKSKLTTNKIGPSPYPDDNRYSKKGENALYLIDKKDFELISKEINLEKDKLLLQKYKIPIDDIKIADISSCNKNINNSILIIFDICETGNISSKIKINKKFKEIGLSEYLFSQKIAGIFKEFGWDGLYIPGVHGSINNHYHNLCIFSPKCNNWENWTSEPYQIYNK